MTLPDPSIYNQQANNPTSALGGSYDFNGSQPKPKQQTYAPGAPPAAQYAPDVGFNANAQGRGEQVSGAMLDYYGANGTPGTSNNAQGAYDSWSQTAGAGPSAVVPRDMSGYYDNASRKAATNINRQMAARGSYGSSNAVGNLMTAETDLRAQQARDEAQYGLQLGQQDLQRAQYGLSRAGLAGSLASAADQSSLAGSQNERNWMSGLSDLAFQNQKTGTGRFLTGLGLEQDAANRASGMVGDTYGQEMDDQKNLLIQQLMASGMTANDAATAANNKLQASQTQDQRAAETMGTIAKYAAFL